jgi:TPR repeat protein
MFGATASGASTSEKNIQNKDGDIADCAKASPDDKKAPGQCQAFIRLELKGIIPKASAATAAAATPPPDVKPAGNDVATVESWCPKGLVMAEGKCTEPKSVAAFLCNPNNATECEEQCGKGNAPSCGTAGTLYVSGRGVSRDEEKARDLLAKGCDAADTKSCTNLGVLMAQGRGGAKDPASAAKNFDRGCGDADALACGMLGMAYKNGDGVKKDDSLLQKGCEGGNDAACGTYGKMLLDGTGTAKDPNKAKVFLRRACDGTQAQACVDVGNMFEASRDSADRRTPRRARSRWGACATTRCRARR